MTIGASLLLIAAGAVLKWAVTAHANGFDIQTAGTIIFIVGLVGLPVALLYTLWWEERWTRLRATPPRRPPPPPLP
jgi:hypothetical protein